MYFNLHLLLNISDVINPRFNHKVNKLRGINLFKEILPTQAAKQQNELKEVKLVVLIK